MESLLTIQRINFQDITDKFNNNVNGEKVSVIKSIGIHQKESQNQFRSRDLTT